MNMFSEMAAGAAWDDMYRVHGCTADVERVTLTPDDYGSQTESWAALIEDLECVMSAVSGREVEKYRKLQVEASHRLLCKPQETAVTEKDRIVKDGVNYDILWIGKAGLWEMALRERA